MSKESERVMKWQKAHPEYNKARAKKYYEKNKDKIIAKVMEKYRIKNRRLEMAREIDKMISNPGGE